MDEPLVRLAVVFGAVLLVFGVRAVRSLRQPRRSRPIPESGLEPGLYLFSSATCEQCAEARARLSGRNFRDLVWEEDHEVFDRLGIGDVPSLMVVGSDGTAVWYPGVPSSIVDNP